MNKKNIDILEQNYEDLITKKEMVNQLHDEMRLLDYKQTLSYIVVNLLNEIKEECPENEMHRIFTKCSRLPDYMDAGCCSVTFCHFCFFVSKEKRLKEGKSVVGCCNTNINCEFGKWLEERRNNEEGK